MQLKLSWELLHLFKKQAETYQLCHDGEVIHQYQLNKLLDVQ